jgi:SnoaL-like domain
MAQQNGIEADADPAELSNLARLLVDSWNRGDARAFACLFTPAAEYVTGAGERIRGRKAISALLDKAAPAAHVSVVGHQWSDATRGLPRSRSCGRVPTLVVGRGGGALRALAYVRDRAG